VAYRFDVYTANPDGSLGTLIKTYDNVYGIGQTLVGPTGAASVGYIEAGTGAVLITVQTKLREAPVDAIGFGAVYDGTNTSAAIQADMDARTALSPINQITSGAVGIGTPLLIKSGSQQNMTIDGTGRVSTIMFPTAPDIKTIAQGVNALIINQKDNGHLHLSKFRVADAVAYTGKFLYCVEGGCSDNSGQALFSAVIEDCWFSFSSNNTGYFQGGFSNLSVSNVVFEGTKDSCFLLEGLGNGDQQYSSITLNNGYDSFLRKADTVDAALIQVRGLHAYQWNRGRLYDLNTVKILILYGTILEPDALNIGDTGLFKLTACTGLHITDFHAGMQNGAPKCAVGIELINVNEGKFEGGFINADTGLKMSGTGTVTLTFSNITFATCGTAFQIASGTLAGKVIFRGCKFNDSLQYGILQSAGAQTMDADFFDCDIINAGLDTVATNRNISVDVAAGKKWRFFDCTIGQNNAAAAAEYYVQTAGPGLLQFYRTTWLGTPPTGITTVASRPYCEFYYEDGYCGVVASATTISLPLYGNVAMISGTTNITAMDAVYNEGRTVMLVFADILTFTDGNNLKLAGNFVTTADDTITLTCIGGQWYELARSAN